MVYTTPSEVSAELGGFSLTASTTPTSTQVESWITDAEKEVNELTGRVWESTAIADPDYEYHDYDGEGIIRLNNTPVISVDSIEYEAEGISAASTSWSSLTEGRTETDDFILYKEEGIINLHATSDTRRLTAGKQNIRVRYTYGYDSVPVHIKRLTTALVAKRLIMSVANKSGSEEGGAVSVGTISVDDPSNYVHKHLESMNQEIDYLTKEVVSKFKSYTYDIRAYDG